MLRSNWNATRTHGVRISIALFAWLLGSCSARARDQGDSAAPAVAAKASAEVATIQPPKGGPGNGQEAGTAGGNAGNNRECAPPPKTAQNPGVQGDPRRVGDASRISAYIRTLCFGYQDLDQNDLTFPVTSGTVQANDSLWFQTEMRMLATDPQKIQPGSGMVVAKILNAIRQRPAKLELWRDSVRYGHEAFLWFGMDSVSKRPYALVLRESGQGIEVISAVGDWIVERVGDHRKPMGAWNPQKFHPGGVHFEQRPGSGWVACSAGCCTARNTNVAL